LDKSVQQKAVIGDHRENTALVLKSDSGVGKMNWVGLAARL